MTVCSSYNCEAKVQPGLKYCARCWQQILAMRQTQKRKPINWWAVFLIVGVLTAFATLHFTGRI
jgi:hypothetical protein